MSFTALSSAWLFALLVPLIAFYFLKLKRPRQIISSLVLWKQVLSDQRVNSPFQRFKRNLLLLLQILLLILLVLAAMQPFLKRETNRANRLPILVDVSASMAAKDIKGKTRLEEAKERLRERIENMPADQELCIIAFSKAARKLTGFTNNKSDLLQAVKELEVQDIVGDLDEALRMTEAISRTAPFDGIAIITDGNLPEKTSFDLPFQVDLQKLPPGVSNIGISQLSARRATNEVWDVLIQLAASEKIPAGSARLVLQEGNELVAEETLTISAEALPRLIIKVPGEKSRLLKVTLSPSGEDALATDNEAWIQLPAIRTLDVYVPESLATFRHALGNIDGIRIYPAKDVATPTSFDLVITDQQSDAFLAWVTCTMGFVPAEIASLVKTEPKSVSAIDWQRESPLLQHAGLEEVIFMEEPHFVAGSDDNALNALGYEVLAYAPAGPLIVGKNDPDNTRFHLLFHPDRSTLPYRVAFPILVTNLVQETLRKTGLQEANAVSSGIFSVANLPANTDVTIEGPGHEKRIEKTDARGTLAGVPATRIGEYRITPGGNTPRIGVSLLAESETTLATVEKIEFSDQISVTAQTVALKSDRSLWWLAACVGFWVLLLEWWWFQRRPV